MSHLADKAVLVTGAAGCIGAWVVKLLRGMGAVPVVYDLVDNRERLHLIMDGADSVAWELGDITDFDRLKQVAEQHSVSAIIHLAALQFHSVRLIRLEVLASTLWAVSIFSSLHGSEALTV